MRKLVGKIKYGLNYALLEELLIKTLISEKIKVCLQQENIHLATEVPMHKHKQNQRGFNQATLIAQWLQKNYNLPHHTLLTKNKQTTPQMQLTRYDRVFNLQNAFEINTKQNIENKNILIVDDVITTGTTLEECARVLKKHGAHKVWGLALASGRN
jgi:ComF family protein